MSNSSKARSLPRTYGIHNNAGFTLVELLITIAIIALLFCLTFPSYSHHLTAVRRATATTALHDLAGRMEQFYAQQNSYAAASLEKLGIDTASTSYRNHYRITIASTADTYTLSAIPSNAQAQADKLCGTLSLDQDGNKKVSGSGDLLTCWR